jgi:hypothetical protein
MNLKRTKMRDAVDQLQRRIYKGDEVVFYYRVECAPNPFTARVLPMSPE